MGGRGLAIKTKHYGLITATLGSQSPTSGRSQESAIAGCLVVVLAA